MKLIAILLGVTALVPAAAFAQAAPVPPEANPRQPGAAVGNDIIITARKISEKLQDAPVSVSVTTAQTIDNLNLNSIADISRITAGLAFDDSFGRDANRPVIRGQANILGQSGVAYFIDGIYFSGSIADYNTESIERIEVVKGPQSALYGRNTYSGAINIISTVPTDRLRGRVSVDASEYDTYNITANLGGPITDSLAAQATGRFYRTGGEFTNQYDGRKIGKQRTYSFSGVFKYDGGGALRAMLRGAFAQSDDGQPAIFATNANSNNCFFDKGSYYAGNGRYFCGTIRPQEINTDYVRAFPTGTDVGLHLKTYNAGLKLDYDVDDAMTLTSLTGYNRRESVTRTDGDYGPNSFQSVIFASFPAGPGVRGLVNSPTDFTFESAEQTEDWSQELRLAYNRDRAHFLLGGYYFQQSDDSQDIRELPGNAAALGTANAAAAGAALCARTPGCRFTFNTSPIVFQQSRNTNNIDTRNIAVFGSVGYDLTNSVSINAEGRYSEERIRQAIVFRNSGTAFPASILAERTYKKFTPRVTLDWKVTPDNLLYAVYAEGQKPGGFNGVASVPTYDQEDARSYEIGLKNTFLDNRLTANLALYHNIISGYQLTQSVFVPGPPLGQVSVVTNAGRARVNGMELELVARPSRSFTFTANYALADAKFTRGFDQNQGVLNDVADDGLVNCSAGNQFPNLPGCTSSYGSIAGKRIPRAPLHQIYADVDFHRPIGGDWMFSTGANVSVQSTNFAQVHNLAQTGGSTVVDARIGVQNDRFRIQFYAKNLFDENSVQQIIRYAAADQDLRRNFIAGLRPGRRLGVVVSAGF